MLTRDALFAFARALCEQCGAVSISDTTGGATAPAWDTAHFVTSTRMRFNEAGVAPHLALVLADHAELAADLTQRCRAHLPVDAVIRIRRHDAAAGAWYELKMTFYEHVDSEF